MVDSDECLQEVCMGSIWIGVPIFDANGGILQIFGIMRFHVKRTVETCNTLCLAVFGYGRSIIGALFYNYNNSEVESNRKAPTKHGLVCA
jgi:uncharacterized membrane protein